MNNDTAISVYELTLHIKSLIESGMFEDIVVRGEISNFKKHLPSGHLYFTLKDEQSEIPAVMFNSNRINYGFTLKDGLKVLVRGSVRVYKARGRYQLYVKAIKKDGLGELYQKFIELKEKLNKEGLFSEEHKKPIPRFPEVIGVVTSDSGAALKDILDTIKRRFPLKVILAPAIVQGEQGAESVVDAINTLNSIPEVDVIIVARGGGSIEDLWNFNDERVVRAIYNSNIPIITGVGHETDFTLADFAADLRAPTPSIAAELATPNKHDVYDQLNSIKTRLDRALENYALQNKQRLDELMFRIENSLNNQLTEAKLKLTGFLNLLEAFNPRGVLERGYSITLFQGNVLKDASVVKENDEVITLLKKGSITSTVIGGKND